MLPFAPVRLSITTCCPSDSDSFCPSARAGVQDSAASARARNPRLILRSTLRYRFVAPALPCCALVLEYGLVLEHAAYERRNLGLIAFLALLQRPFVLRREDGRLDRA